MIGSLLAVLLLTAQPAPEEAPVETDTEVQVQIETPAVQADVRTEAEAAAQPAAEAAAEAEAAPPTPDEEIICRRRLRPSERIGQRHRVVEDCRTRAEWESARRRPRRGS